MPTYETLKPKTNIPELVTFQYNEPQTGEGQYGTWYKYAIENRGVNKVLFPTKFLNDKLQAFQPLQGKTLEIVLIEIDGGKKDWRVNVPGQGGTNTPIPSQNFPERNFEADNRIPVGQDGMAPSVQETIAKMRVAFKSIVDAHKALEKRVGGLETLVTQLTSKDALDLHQGFNDSKSIDIEIPDGL